MGSMETVTVPRPLVRQMLDHARASPAVEVCGLVGARAGVPVTVYPVANVAAEAARRFHMDPREQIAAMRAQREGGESLFAIYHSHPQGPPRPSATDLREAAYPDVLYLIIHLASDPPLHGFRLVAGHFEPVPLSAAP